MSKDNLLNIVEEYQNLGANISDIIKQSGYKNKFIAKRLNLPMSTFYFKKKSNSFSPEQVKQIVNIAAE